MAWFTRFTRFGDAHVVYGQEKQMTCGLASVMMVIFKKNKLVPGKTSVTTEEAIRKEYEARLGSSYTGHTVGTFPTHLCAILQTFVPTHLWVWRTPAPDSVPRMMIDRIGVNDSWGPSVEVKPMILGVDWDAGGAHWVVADTIRKVGKSHYATICDPWDTNVHIQEFKTGQPFVYDATSGGFMIDVSGTHYTYDSNSAKGQVKTWGMIYGLKR
jgi:hypothetical protein